MSPVIRAFAQFTQPVLLISSSFHAGLTVPWVLLANAMTYALVGLAVDKLRQEFRPTR
jgi:thiosulfate reductase cytochrome b subunit